MEYLEKFQEHLKLRDFKRDTVGDKGLIGLSTPVSVNRKVS